MNINFLLFIMLCILSCGTNMGENLANDPEAEDDPQDNVDLSRDNQAVVVDVSISGDENAYTFSVQLLSPDTGCDQYADWWEIIDRDGQLIYRRILGHSHVGEQPFTRSGGLVNINQTQFVYVRGHMNNLGYGSLVMSGSVADGFVSDTLATTFAKGLEGIDPQPGNCPF